ncbi:hypothetical protein B0H13DRAFT_2316339 [Mycena leptocephala]|nr:hypothetical protein B0H13DRAFT_2316339 [Mycena leptocephala]
MPFILDFNRTLVAPFALCSSHHVIQHQVVADVLLALLLIALTSVMSLAATSSVPAPCLALLPLGLCCLDAIHGRGAQILLLPGQMLPRCSLALFSSHMPDSVNTSTLGASFLPPISAFALCYTPLPDIDLSPL